MNFNEYTFSGVAQLDFTEFSRRMEVISDPEATKLRNHFITSFLDMDSEWYKTKIEERKLFSDGWYYTGYLWECIKKFELRRVIDILEALQLMDQTIYVMCDMHSNDSVRVQDYWKFPRESVLAGESKNLALGLGYLPLDIYIYDKTFDWTLILTHEHDDKGRTCCKGFPARS